MIDAYKAERLPNKYPINNEPIKEGDWYINLITWQVERATRNVAINWKRNMSYNDGTRFLRDDYKKITLVPAIQYIDLRKPSIK